MTIASRWTITTLGLAALTLCTTTASLAQEETQTITAQGVTFEIPKDWKQSRPASTMRAAQIEIGPAEGDEEAAELVLFVFPGGAGTVQANVDRWQQQFVGEDGKPPKIETSKGQGKNVEATAVETAGRYVAAVQPGLPQQFDKSNYRLLGGIVTTPQAGYFFKLVGPDKTVNEARPAFEAMLKSMELQK
ncbi:hypothetical protein BH23PLA1_BH23PLA1_41350 [soil metagenome]